MSNGEVNPISQAELAAEGGTALPDKEVMSLLDLNANLDLALDVGRRSIWLSGRTQTSPRR